MENLKTTTDALRSKFIDPTYDRGFQLLMMNPECPELMLEFLRAMIPERDIASIEFRPTDSVPDREEDKRKLYDIYCTDADGNIFIVEMQREPYRSYGDRLVVYAGNPATRLLRKGEAYDKVRALYIISILRGYLQVEGEQKSDRQKLVRRAVLKMDDSEKILSQKINYLFLQLPAAKPIGKESTFLEQWAWHLGNIGKAEEIPEGLSGYFRMMYEHCCRENIESGKLKEYDDMVRDEITIEAEKRFAIEEAVEEALARGNAEGRAEGKAEGEAKGREEERLATARKMKSKDIPISTIVEITGLTAEQVESL